MHTSSPNTKFSSARGCLLATPQIVCIRCPKSLGQFLKPHISKTTVHNGKFETYLERKNMENYSDTKLEPICNISVGRYKLKWFSCITHTTKHYLHLRAQVSKAIVIAVVMYAHEKFHASVHLMFCSIHGRSRHYFYSSWPLSIKKFSKFFFWASLRTERIAQYLGIKKIIENYRKIR